MTLYPVAIAALLIAFAAQASFAAAQGIPPADRKSGFDQMGPDTQAMQRDDARNPAMLSVREGEALWSEATANGKPSCAGCHQQAPVTMKGIAAHYPAFDTASDQPIDLAGRIQQCRTERQASPAWARESSPLLALTAYIGLQSRGTIVEPSSDARLAPFRDEGKQLFSQRIGQLNLSCAMCHDDNWGKKLGGSVIPQGHANGYPLFRLEWQGMGSLQRRIRNCLTGVRAEPFAYGDPALVNLELYLQERGAGLKVETPAVRP
jgi:L-cysteine S-thiosulfotransferase